jgi:ribonuclease HI
MNDLVTIYTDGACRGNPGPGGWGALLQFGVHEKTLNGSAAETTNNRMEMIAAIESLGSLKRSCQVDLYTDSQYLRRGVLEWLESWKKRQWKTAARKPVKNRDLWEALDRQINRHRIRWHWVKGHAGNPGNEKADWLANQAIDNAQSQGMAN